jgi:hypothetical protein
MNLENLPHTTLVQRIIPKNAFDVYTTSKQRKLFTDQIAKITWTHKLAPETINLEAKEIKEIQVFRIELKVRVDIQPILDVIDKAIPYHIVFQVVYEDWMYLSTSSKHPHPVNIDNAVIDYRFKTDWLHHEESNYKFQLRKSIDAVYLDFCRQLTNQNEIEIKSVTDFVNYNARLDRIQSEINKLKQKISAAKQFNKKVEYNLKLKQFEQELEALIINT